MRAGRQRAKVGKIAGTVRRLRRGLGPALVCLMLAAPRVDAATAKVQYLSSSSVYLDAGRDAGLESGTTVQVKRDGKVVAELVVEFVAQSSAACRIVSSVSPVRIGDTCTFTPAAGTEPGPAPGAGAAVSPAARTPVAAGSWLSPLAMHGSLALAYRRSGDGDGSFSNPAVRADLRWDGPERRQLLMRVRADRPVADFGPTATGLPAPETVRLYEAEVRYRSAGERFEMSGGRFIPARLEPMGYLDGGAAVIQPAVGLRIGAVGGAGARLVSNGFETAGWKAGGYIEGSDPRRNGPTRWRLLLAAARLEDPDITRRQFVLGRADQRLGSRLRAWQYVEIDVNPGWKTERGEDRVEWTALSVGAQTALHKKVDLSLGYDSRRDQLLPEQLVISPGNSSLDRTRGVHGAVNLRLSRWTSLRLGGDWRALEDGTRTTLAWDGSLYGSHPRLPALSGIVHANIYDAAAGRGELLDASLSLRATDYMRLELAGGTHNRRDLADFASDLEPRSNWIRVGGGLDPGLGVWVDASAEWRTAPSASELQLGIGGRF